MVFLMIGAERGARELSFGTKISLLGRKLAVGRFGAKRLVSGRFFLLYI